MSKYQFITDEEYGGGVVDDLLWEWKLGVTADVTSNGSWEFSVNPLAYITQVKKREEQGSLINEIFLVSCHVEDKQCKIHWGYADMSRQEVEKVFALLMEIVSEIELKLLEKVITQ